MNKAILVGLLLLLIAPVMASSYYKQETDVDMKIPCINNYTYCGPTATCNLTIFYPNASVLINNQPMTNQLTYFNYTINSSQTETTGNYTANMFCNDSGTMGYSIFDYIITLNGNPPAGDGLSVFMLLATLACICFAIYFIFITLAKLAEFEVTLQDVLYNLITYIIVFGIYAFNQNYYSDALTESMLSIFIKVGIWTNIIVPLIAFILCMIYHKTQFRNSGGEEV